MRALLRSLAGALLLAALPALAQEAGRPPYTIDQEPTEKFTVQEGDQNVLYVKVKFTVTRQGGEQPEEVGKKYKILIEENGHRVKEEDVPQPQISEDLSVVLAIDLSGSMKAAGRMDQTRKAADVFLKALPGRADCGQILFDHEIRVKEPPTTQRGNLRRHILANEPRGGTAYLDAALEAINMLQKSR